MKFRATFSVVIFALIYGGLIFRVYNLQVEQGFDYLERVEARDNIAQNNEFARGVIYFTDRYNKLVQVAINKKVSGNLRCS